MSKQKNKSFHNILLLVIFLISITYSSFLYLKGDNFQILKKSITPIDVYFYAPNYNQEGASLLNSISARMDSNLILREYLFNKNNNIEFMNIQKNLLSSFNSKSLIFSYNFYGNIEDLDIDKKKLNNYLWKNYKDQFQIELNNYNENLKTNVNNSQKVIEAYGIDHDDLTNKFKQFDISNCELFINYEDTDTAELEIDKQTLDIRCNIRNYDEITFSRSSFFEIFNYEIFIRESINLSSSKKYNLNYLVFSFLALASFIFLLLINFKKLRI